MIKKKLMNKAFIKIVLKRMWIAFSLFIILAAILSSLFRALTPFAKEYKTSIEANLSQLIGQPVTIQSIKTGWYWFHPVLKLEHLTIKEKEHSLHFEKLFIGINLFKSLLNWQIQPGLLYLEQAHITIRKEGQEWQIEGIKQSPTPNLSAKEAMQNLVAVLSQQERIIIKKLTIDLYVDAKKLLPINSFNLSLVNKNNHFRIKGDAQIDQRESFKLLTDIDFDPEHFDETEGTVYFSGTQLNLSQWQKWFFPQYALLKKGSANYSLWLDIKHGDISSGQSQIALNDLVIKNKDKKNYISSFYANMAWKLTSRGWQYSADHIQFDLDKIQWPENQMSVEFDKAQQSYLIFSKHILLQSLLSAVDKQWPELTKTIHEIKIQGDLSDFQIVLKEQKPHYLLTRFKQLSWSHYNNTSVSNLSGVIQWEPQEGHLELDTEQSTIEIKNYPKQNLTLLNGVIDWKELSNGLRVSIDRFALSQPELTLSLEGVLDEVSAHSVGNIRIDLDFSAKNIQQWMPYLPKKQMKVKLFNWLNQDIKRIQQATGSISIKGLAKDFPFDNNTGEFTVISHLLGGELLITPKWKLIKELEAYIRLKNRDLEVDIVNGDAQGVPIKQMNLRLDDIGKDKETLLIHSIIEGPAQKMLNFVIASPLKEKLSKLKMLLFKGVFSLDVNIEVPLYPENDDNLVKGILYFQNNDLEIKHRMISIPIEALNGSLSFNEEGVNESTLSGTAFDYPLNIKIQSTMLPKPATLMTINGECSIDSLKTKFNLPIFSLFKGFFAVDALFKITSDPNDLDNLKLHSTLEGMAINVPSPLGKKYNEPAPLDINLEFNEEKMIHLRGDYNHKLSTDLLFEQNENKEFALKSGEISLGDRIAVDQKKPGLSLVGSLNDFNLEAWKKVFARFADDDNSFILNNLRSFNLTLNQLTFLQQKFSDLRLKGTLLANKDWSVGIQQKKVSADLTYNVTNNLIGGFIHFLSLDKIKLTKTDENTSSLKPEQIPNFNLRVDNLSIGGILIGDLTLKSHSTPERWTVDYCRIETPNYQLMLEGGWTQKNKANHTDVQLKVHFNKLSKSLEAWGITPAVHSKKGDLSFNGGWRGRFDEFSLASLNGAMDLQLNDGRITHLSPETEEKLGLGKLLSILSLQTIPRRLHLDFSDLSQEGYSFDMFKGHFTVAKGIMNTQDSYIDGPVAYASMKGDLDIVHRMYDLNLSISPHITASLPVVATIAGGPIVGLSVWVASKIINQGMQKISAYSYKISGPWDQPVVQQLSIIKKIMKKE